MVLVLGYHGVPTARDGHTHACSHLQMGLRAAAAGALDQFGAASNYWHLGDSSYESLLSDHFTAVTPEIGCKWSDVQAAPGVFTFSECDRVLEAAEAAVEAAAEKAGAAGGLRWPMVPAEAARPSSADCGWLSFCPRCFMPAR